MTAIVPDVMSPEELARKKRDAQRAQLRPLANRRPELYDEDELSSDEFEAMMEMYNGTLASIE
jgi:small subunit ribosomal protein S1